MTERQPGWNYHNREFFFLFQERQIPEISLQPGKRSRSHDGCHHRSAWYRNRGDIDDKLGAIPTTLRQQPAGSREYYQCYVMFGLNVTTW